VVHTSSLRFSVVHALRVKGFAATAVVVELTGAPAALVEAELTLLAAEELAVFRENRGLWQLTPKGREQHADLLAEDVAAAPLTELAQEYERFVALNTRFKELCGDWQLRDGAPNDHADAAYDRAVVERLLGLDAEAQAVLAELGRLVRRYQPYGPRLAAAARGVAAGQQQLFTGVLVGSYHDIWMELHEDLILTLGINRAKEGSF
jgi:hypothetical protein